MIVSKYIFWREWIFAHTPCSVADSDHGIANDDEQQGMHGVSMFVWCCCWAVNWVSWWDGSLSGYELSDCSTSSRSRSLVWLISGGRTSGRVGSIVGWGGADWTGRLKLECGGEGYITRVGRWFCGDWVVDECTFEVQIGVISGMMLVFSIDDSWDGYEEECWVESHDEWLWVFIGGSTTS